MFSPLTKQLTEALRALPGVGPKTAARMAFQLLSEKGRQKGEVLADTLKNALTHVKHCERCRQFTETPLCQLCANPKRDHSILCVIENPADVMALEQTFAYSGLYFILHGHLSPLDGITPKDIGIPILLERLANNNVIHEVILATNPTAEGRATAQYIMSRIDTKKIKCTQLAHGIPIGGELEYMDGGTLAHAIYSRVTVG